MSFKLKTKKISIILLSIAGGTMTLTSNGLAANTAVYYNSTNNSSILSINNPLSRTITLGASGNYRLVDAASAGSFVSQDPNEVVEFVNANDRILISGNGEYNVTMEDVKISADGNGKKNGLKENGLFEIKKGANVKLTLKGNNILSSSPSRDIEYGIYIDNSSKLTITKLSDGSSLEVSGFNISILGKGIFGKIITIEGGNIKVGGDYTAISTDGLLTIKGGNIEGFVNKKASTSFDRTNMHAPEHIKARIMNIDGGHINCNMSIKKDLIINDSDINGNIMAGGDLIINNSNINADNIECGALNMIVDGGEIHTDQLCVTRNMIVNSGDIHAAHLVGVTFKGDYDGDPHPSKVIINQGTLQANEISNVGIKLNDGEIFIRSINGVVWDTNLFNNLFGRSDNIMTNSDGEVTAYTSEHFDINGGSINGIQYISK